MVGEKFEAMVELGAANTRQKDFYDLWFIFPPFEFATATLLKAVEATFARSQTVLPASPEVFTVAFANDATKQTQWSAFLRRNGPTGASIHFSEVVETLRRSIEPVLKSAQRSGR